MIPERILTLKSVAFYPICPLTHGVNGGPGASGICGDARLDGQAEMATAAGKHRKLGGVFVSAEKK